MNWTIIAIIIIIGMVGFLLVNLTTKEHYRTIGSTIMLLCIGMMFIVVFAIYTRVKQLEPYQDDCPVYEKIEEPIYRLKTNKGE